MKSDVRRPLPRRPAAAPARGPDGLVRLYGVHPVEAALNNPARVPRRLMATENAARRLAAPLRARLVEPERVTPRDLDRLLGADAVHQGVMLETEPLPEPKLEELAARSVEAGALVVLDQVTDPHNVGAILRSAAVFGASGLVMTRRHSPPFDGALAKAASGALELVPVALVPNLARALGELKAQGVRLVGLDGTADALIEDEVFAPALALVLGAEGKGLRQLTRDTCDALARIGAAGGLASLNVSNAAAVALHVVASRRRRHG
jgi:23S rRNA (guanosine2251-2'-O)-methyltransferase